MVKEYAERLYTPAGARRTRNLRATTAQLRPALSQWKAQMRKDWPQVRIFDVQVGNTDRQNIQVGEALQVSARVHLGPVDPDHVRVEAYHGEADNGGCAIPRSRSWKKAAARRRRGLHLPRLDPCIGKRHLWLQRARCSDLSAFTPGA